MVAARVERGSTVVDLCCGDCALERLLVGKECSYIGLDSSKEFVRAGRRRGVNVLHWEGPLSDFPEGDVICIQSSLYQFMPDEKLLVERMIAKARLRVVISEPIRNLSDSGNPVFRMLARWLTSANMKSPVSRHTMESIRSLAAALPGNIELSLPIDREALLVITKPAQPQQ